MALLKSLIRIFIGTIIAIPMILYPYLYFFQDKLLFYPQKIETATLKILRKYHADSEIKLKTPDNITLHGWFLKANKSKKSPLLIYFGGNAEEVSGHISEKAFFKNYSLLLMNYRGYGLSKGKPSEKNLFKDALFIYDTFAKRTDVDSRKIVAMGRSLGSGVAVYLAKHRRLEKVILVSPYDSIQNVAQKIYPYAPISLLLKHPFDSLSRAPSISTPMLALIADNDTVISPEHSKALVKKWKGKTKQVIIQNTEHNSITSADEYWANIEEYLD